MKNVNILKAQHTQRLTFWVPVAVLLMLIGVVSFSIIARMGDDKITLRVSDLEELQQYPKVTPPIESAREAIGFVAHSDSTLAKSLREHKNQMEYSGWLVTAKLHEEDASRWWKVGIRSYGKFIPSYTCVVSFTPMGTSVSYNCGYNK
jgi:hypothetical protein